MKPSSGGHFVNQYKKLLSNTFIIGIGTFSSKVLVFLLMPLYTRLLTSSDYGVADLIVQTSNLLIPVATLGIANAVIRFGLDKSVKKSDVFTTGFITILCGFSLLLLLEPVLRKIQYISVHTTLIYLFVLMSSLRSLCSQFVRSKQLVKLYALDGLISTATTIGFTILFLVVFRLGIVGYIMAIVLSDALSTLFLFCVAGLFHYIHIKGIDRNSVTAMLRYSIPLIPTTILWWITNVSDRYLVTYMVGSAANGLYAVAYKIPTMVILISGIFMEAWQLSAVTESQKELREQFFTKVFDAYQAIIFLSASVLILLSKFLTTLLVSPAFYQSWRYIPFLVMSTVFSCFVTFLGSIYMVEKKSFMTMLTTVAAAAINIVLNLILIPTYGADGAAFATFISYFSVFIIRAIHTRTLIKITWNPVKQILNSIILLAQGIIMITELNHWLIYEIILVIFLFTININMVIANVKKLISHG